jgi:predicted MPP superfamily phosphohydrolase
VLENRAVQAAEGFYVAGTKPWPMHLEQAGENGEDSGSLAWAASNGYFTLLLAHEPAQIDDNSKLPFALQLSGHTHGGQVALPFIGPLGHTYATGGYDAGLYKVNGTTLYVSRGIGTMLMRVRFLVPPEIVVLTLRRK